MGPKTRSIREFFKVLSVETAVKGTGIRVFAGCF